MPDLVLNPLQKRIYEILTADVTLTDLLASTDSVYDNPPDDVDTPYIKIGDDSAIDWGSHTADGFQVTVTLHAWTEDSAKKLNKDILDRMYQLLHETDLAIPGFTTVCFRCILSQVLVEPDDNRTFHGVQRYNLTVTGS
jgi:hypothetical protein